MTARVAAIWLIVATLLATCQVNDRPEYSIVHLNTGRAEIDDVAVKYGDFTSLCGVLMPNAEKIQAGVKAPVPATVTVVWTTQDGKAHEQTVAVRGPRPFRKLTVTINGDDLTVVAE